MMVLMTINSAATAQVRKVNLVEHIPIRRIALAIVIYEHRRVCSGTVAKLDPSVQIHSLQHRTEIVATLAGAGGVGRLTGDVAWCSLGVLDVEDRFACLYHRSKGLALVVLRALLVDRELDDRGQIGKHLAGVLQSDRDVVGDSHVGEICHVRYGVCLCEVQAIVVVLRMRSASSAISNHRSLHT